MKVGVSVAVLSGNRVLLIKREDFEVWSLPGGMLGTGESFAKAALREVREEVGLTVSLQSLVGLYSRTGEQDVHSALFTASMESGQLKVNPKEVLEAEFFTQSSLPEKILWWHRQQIKDALSNISGSYAWRFNVKLPFPAKSRADLYSIRDKSSSSRSDFYIYAFESMGIEDYHLEVRPKLIKRLD